jgi:hypothetical protein
MRSLVFCAVLLAAGWPLAGQVRSPVVANDNGKVVVAWVHGSPARVAVARWDHGGWTPLPAPDEGSALSAAYVSLTSGPGGLYAAWTERPESQWSGFDNVHGELWVARWDGSSWKKLGPSLTRSQNTISDLPQIREDSHGRPWIMWAEITADFNVENVYAAKWNGAQWETFDQGTLSTDVSSSSRARDFLLDSEDRPLLAWSRMPDFQTDYQVAVGIWDGQHWVPGVSANPNVNRYAGAPSMVLDQGRPLVALIQAAKGFDVWVERWTGNRWEPLGTSLNAGSGGAHAPHIVLTAAGPLVAWIENHGREDLRAAAWTGDRWTEADSAVRPDGRRADVSAIGLAASPDGPVLVWAEAGVPGWLGAARWTGTAWASLGSPAGSGR